MERMNKPYCEVVRERKESYAKKWEECFGKKIDEALTPEGLTVFWADTTSSKQALEMLDKAAKLEMIDDLLDAFLNAFGVNVIVVDDDDDEEEEVKSEGGVAKKFAVLDKTDDHVYPDRFETADDAYGFIKVICMNTTHTFDDFKVLEEM